MLYNGVLVSALQQCESDIFIRGFKTYVSGASLLVQTVKNLPAMHVTWVQSLGWEDLLEKGKATHSSILA